MLGEVSSIDQLTTVYTVTQPAIYSISASVTYKFCKLV